MLLICACTSTLPQPRNVFPNGKYVTYPPTRNMTSELEQVLSSVRKLSTISYYKAYHFSAEQKITRDQVDTADLEELAEEQTFFHESASGTATILLYDFSSIAVLTCAHVGDYPDTIFKYFGPEDAEDFLSTVGIKIRTEFFVNKVPAGDELKLLAIDKESDLALYGKHYAAPRKPELLSLTPPLGKSNDLQWASFVYLAGFPMGIKMITRGVVSLPPSQRDGNFVMDANFNRGFSGGLVLAMREGESSLEWVGIVKSVSADAHFRFKPAPEELRNVDVHRPYKGDIFLERVLNINYGVTYAVGANAIRAFFKKHKSSLKKQGFDLSGYTE